MSIYSMTGFGRGESSNDDFQVTVEIKSVNHRFKDLRFKMPSIFNSLEMNLKSIHGEYFKRGSFDIYVNFKRAENKSKFEDIDLAKVDQFLDVIKPKLESKGLNVNVDPTLFLKPEFQKDQELDKDESLKELIVSAFSAACEDLKKSRLSEGEKMIKVIENHKNEYLKEYSVVVEKSDEFKSHVEQKLKKKIDDLSSEISIDEPRYLQEVIYYLEKMDVHEEINRIQSHIDKLNKLLGSSGEVGRQIDFLIQELNRETNTIGSKSSMEEISNAVVQMKVQLEKIREQGLNLE